MTEFTTTSLSADRREPEREAGPSGLTHVDWLAEMLQRMEGRFRRLESKLESIERRLPPQGEPSAGRVLTELREALTSVERGLVGVTTEVRSGATDMSGRLEREGEEWRTAFQRLEQAQARLEEARPGDGIRENLADLRTKVSTLEEAIGRLASLEDALRNLAKRTAAKRMERSNQEAAAQMSAFVDRLSEAGEAFAARTGELESRFEGLRAEVKGLFDEGRTEQQAAIERVNHALDQAGSALRHEIVANLRDLREHTELLAGPRSDIQAVRSELAAMEERIQEAFRARDEWLARESEAQTMRLREFLRGVSARVRRLSGGLEAARAESDDLESQLRRLEDGSSEPEPSEG